MGVEKRFLDYGYQSVLPNMESITKLSEIVVDVKPDVALFHTRFETSPSDHGNVGVIAEHAVRSATRVLACKDIPYPGEMYTYEIYPRSSPPYPLFQPDTYIDISGVIKEVVDAPNHFDQFIYGEYPPSKRFRVTRSKVKIDYLGEEEIPLYGHGEMKLTLSRFRGFQCGARYAEAYMALDKKVMGSRILQTII